MQTRAGEVYLAPGDRHMLVVPGSLQLHLTMEPPENYMRPAADPLFRSVAAAFGQYSVAAVLTGMGRDGSLGAATIAAVGGKVVAQDPRTAVAPSMPQTVINIGAASSVVPLDVLGATLRSHVQAMVTELQR
jgi:two-component system chemotaxis response regulator CheB